MIPCVQNIPHDQAFEGAYLVSAPGEHRQRHRDRNVDSNLSNLDLDFELASCSTALSKDRSAIAVLVLVVDGESVVQGVCFDNDQNRSENLLTSKSKSGVSMN